MAMPTITKLDGPAPMPGSAFDLAAVGYIEEEFLIEGTASSFSLVGERGGDGQWRVEPDQQSAYVTRVIVRRPCEAAKFSGEAIVEWNNVSGGVDATPEWTIFHRHMIRCGHAFVGVAAQRAGMHGGGITEGMHLKRIFPERYADVEHPGDAWSFDIYTQIGELLLDGALLEGMRPHRLVSVGASQSAVCLVTYINAIQPVADLYDAFLVHGRGARGAALDGFRGSLRSGQAERIRDDLAVPIIVLQSETDVILLGGARAGQADSENLRLWEVAGSAHADTYMLMAGSHDDGSLAPADLAELLRPTSKLVIGETESPVNGSPQLHYIGQSALATLSSWAATGAPAPAAARLAVNDDGNGLATDQYGNATGGIRSPWIDVPTTTSSGLGQKGGTFGMLFGITRPFDAASIDALYPGGAPDYLARFERALSTTINDGFILAEDRDEILSLAEASFESR